MNTPLPHENELIRAYVTGTLAEPALTDFELHMLASPRLQEQVEMELALRDGMRNVGQTLAPSVLARPAKSVSRRALSRHPMLAVAAGFVCGMVLPALVLWRTHAPGVDDFSPRGNVPALLIDPVRSVNADVVLEVAPNASMLLLQVPVYPHHAKERYSLRIEREDGAPVAELDELVPDANDLISALLPAATLPSGRYRLDLESRHAGGVGEQRRIVLRVTSVG